MLPECKEQLRILRKTKKEPIPIIRLNRELFKKKLNQETGELIIIINNYKKLMNFNVTKLRKYKVVLEILWLSRHNLEID